MKEKGTRRVKVKVMLKTIAKPMLAYGCEELEGKQEKTSLVIQHINTYIYFTTNCKNNTGRASGMATYAESKKVE